MLYMFVRLYNQNQMRQIGCGWRYVFIAVGRKWVRVLDWSTGDQSRISSQQFAEMGAVDCKPPRLKYLRRGEKRSQRAKKMYRAALDKARERSL